MGKGRTLKVENSLYQKFILDCIEKDMNASEITKALNEKGANFSIPTISKFIKKVKKNGGVNIAQFKTEAESKALQINEKLQKIPELTGVLSRRNFLIDNLLDRRKKVLEYANEGKRSNIVYQSSDRLLAMLEKFRPDLKSEQYLALEIEVKFLRNYIKAHFLPDEIFPQLEDTLRKYTMDIHEICKYVEQWTSKYEVDSLLEKLTEMITRSAVSTFGPLLKKQTEEERKCYIDKFITEVESAVQDIKEYEIKLSENSNVKK